MRDVEFLLTPLPAFTRSVFYCFKEGLLRQRLYEHLESGSRPTPLASISWNQAGYGRSLFDQIDVCDLSDVPESSGGQQARALSQETAIRALLAKNELVVIFLDRALETLDEDLQNKVRGKCIVVEENTYDAKSLALALRYLEASTDLVINASLLDQRAFLKHFYLFVSEVRRTSFAEIQQEFERTVLLFVDRTTGAFRPIEAKKARQRRMALMQPLRKLVFDRSPDAIAELIKQIESREPAATTQSLLDQLLVGTRRLCQSAFQSKPDDFSLAMLAIWTAVLLASAKAHHKDQNVAGTTFVDDLARQHLMRSSNDRLYRPLEGLWETFPGVTDVEMTKALREDLSELYCSAEPLPFVWMRKWHAELLNTHTADSLGVAAANARKQSYNHLKTYSEFSGHQRAIAMLKERRSEQDFSKPLLLIGPDGVGKAALALACPLKSGPP